MSQIDWSKMKEVHRVMKTDKVAIKFKTDGKNVDVRLHVGGAPDFPQHTQSGITFDASQIDEVIEGLKKCKSTPVQ